SLSSIKPNEDGSSVDAGQEVDGALVIARGYGAELLKLAEEVFDEVALLVEVSVVGAPDAATRHGRDHWGDAGGLQRFDHPLVGVEGLVSQQGVGVELRQKAISALQIVSLAGCQQERRRIAQGIDQGVDLGAQSSSTAPDRLIAAVFLRAPGLCWWAGTMVES